MSCTTWTPRAVSSEAAAWRERVWRIVEAQHVAATMKLVDDCDEQDLLEALLDAAKPAPPPATRSLDDLLATPWRYPPRQGGSRFRGASDPGVFYGAQTLRTAAAELGYWRWRFLLDAVDLERLDPVAHTAFRVDIATTAVDLRAPPFDADAALWQHPHDDTATQRFARVARDAGIGAIVYRSVRDQQPAWCVALLTPAGFAARAPDPRLQIWYLAVTRDDVVWRRDGASMRFAAATWR